MLYDLCMQVVPGQERADNPTGHPDHRFRGCYSGLHFHPHPCTQGGQEEQWQGTVDLRLLIAFLERFCLLYLAA